MSDSTTSSQNSGNEVVNVPNVISASRLVLAVILIVLIPLEQYWAAMTIFVIAAGTDWVDGWWARKFDQVTQVGRILDSFCDKIVILGTFVMLAEAMKGEFVWYARITGWMATLILGREMLVTALRSFIENAGGDFSAKMAGKVKFVLQCVAATLCLWLLARKASPGIEISDLEINLTAASIWLALASTIYSGAGYVIAAAKFISQSTSSK